MKYSYAVLLCLLAQWSCRETPPEPPPPHQVSITLSVEDVSCTEAFLKVSLTDAGQPRWVGIRVDGQRLNTAELSGSDTVMIVGGLFPHRAYTFVAERLSDTTAIESSTPVQATTMDTTSHDWVFTLDTLGVTASSLQDVAIISDSLVYAVGEMYLNDSTGQLDLLPYNMAQWKGRTWATTRIQFFTVCGQSHLTPYPASSVFPFAPPDVWISMDGSQVARWDGRFQTSRVCLPISFSIRRLWGMNTSHVYVVGDGGNIMEYDGSVWHGLQSGTSLPIRDVFGARRNTSSDYEILCVADSYGSSEGSKVLSIKDGVVRELWNDGRPYGLDATWFVPGRRYIVVGSGVWSTRSPGGSWALDNSLPRIHTTSIDGQGLNDYVVCGAFGLLAHNNGVSWRTFFPVNSGAFTSVAMKGNLIVAVGGIGDRAIIARGTRPPTKKGG